VSVIDEAAVFDGKSKKILIFWRNASACDGKCSVRNVKQSADSEGARSQRGQQAAPPEKETKSSKLKSFKCEAPNVAVALKKRMLCLRRMGHVPERERQDSRIYLLYCEQKLSVNLTVRGRSTRQPSRYHRGATNRSNGAVN
jgi:hypothetical protein